MQKFTNYFRSKEATLPKRDDLPAFSAFFSTYLENSFVLVRDPGKRLYSPDAHCFCPMCSRLVDVPNLKTRKPSTADKRRARKLKVATVSAIAAAHSETLSDGALDNFVDDPNLRTPISLVTYAYDLLNRLNVEAVGPATLILWRSFAWTPEGSPRKSYVLPVDQIMDAQNELRQAVLRVAG